VTCLSRRAPPVARQHPGKSCSRNQQRSESVCAVCQRHLPSRLGQLWTTRCSGGRQLLAKYIPNVQLLHNASNSKASNSRAGWHRHHLVLSHCLRQPAFFADLAGEPSAFQAAVTQDRATTGNWPPAAFLLLRNEPAVRAYSYLTQQHA